MLLVQFLKLYLVTNIVYGQSCPQEWINISHHGCFYIDTTNLRDFYMSMEYCNDLGGYMVEFLTQVLKKQFSLLILTSSLSRRWKRTCMIILVILSTEFFLVCLLIVRQTPGPGFTPMLLLMRLTGTQVTREMIHTDVPCP